MKKIISGTILTAMLLLSLNTIAQDPQFSNYNQALTFLNPSFSGTNGFMRTQNNFRIHRNDFYNSITTTSAFDAYIKPLHGGVSASMIYEDAYGITKSTGIMAAYAHHFSLFHEKLKIIPSVQAGYYVQKYDLSWIYYDPASQSYMPHTSKEKVDFTDINSGVLFQTQKSSFGFSAFHLNKPKVGLYDYTLLTRFHIHWARDFKLSSNFNLSGFILYSSTHMPFYNSGFSFLQLNSNLSWRNKLIFGAGWRMGDAISANIGYQGKTFGIRAAYEHLYSWLSRDNVGVFELMLSFNFRKKANMPAFSDWKTW